MADYDIAIIGGGLTGTSIARDAAGRGLRVILMEQSDLGSGATASSMRLLHGNFIDLERGALLSARKALAERDTMLRIAPHIARPTRYVMAVHQDERPLAILRAGSLLYDGLAPAGIHAPSRVLDLTHDPMGHPLKRSAGVALEFFDGLLDDSRLTVLNAVDAAAKGAVIRTGARCARADRSDEWRIAMINRGQREVFTARTLVNATGPWTTTVADTILRLPGPALKLSRVSYIVVRRLCEHDRVYVLQNDDKRLIYAIPYERDFTLIGTHVEDFKGDPAIVAASSADVAYLCRAAARYFRENLNPGDVIRAGSGPEAMQSSGTASACLRLERKFGEAPLLTVFGGDTTGARRLAELVLSRMSRFFVLRRPWTSEEPLPGGDFAVNAFDDLVDDAQARWPFLTERNARRLIGAYGTRVDRVLGNATAAADLGSWFGVELSAAEVRYLMRHEWARFADDVIWRRSKLGLSMTASDVAALEAFMAESALA